MSRIIHVQEHTSVTRWVLCAAVLAPLAWWLASVFTEVPTPTPTPPLATRAAPSRSATAFAPPPITAPATNTAPRVNTSGVPAVALDIRERNRTVQVSQLTLSRPSLAEAFLSEVHLSPNPRGGFVVQEVAPDGRHHKLGLQPGDVVYSLDTPKMAAVDDSSMTALMQQTEIELDVYRNGSLLRLRHAYNTDPPAEAQRAPDEQPPSR